MSVDDLTSTTAKRGMSGFWEFPDFPITWAFEAGLPDPATFPLDDLARFSEAVLREEAADALQYGAAQKGGIIYGYEGLRQQLADRSGRIDGRELDVSNVMLTSGGVQAIKLACDAFFDTGDVIAVEAPTWGAVLMSANTKGVESIAIPMDDDGMIVDVLAERIAGLEAEGKKLKLVYTIATFNTPAGVSLSLPRRRQLLDLAKKHRFVILEDNVYGELRYDGEPIPTIFSLDDAGLVIKVDSFSKTLAPGLRLGWVSGSKEAIGALSAVKGDLGVSQWTARTVSRFLAAGLYEAHLAKVNDLYRKKRDVTEKALRDHCGDRLKWRTPEGGYFLWLELSDEIDGAQVMQNAMADGVMCRPGERFFGDSDADAHKQWFRLAFIQVPIEEIERGIGVLGKAIEKSVK